MDRKKLFLQGVTVTALVAGFALLQAQLLYAPLTNQVLYNLIFALFVAAFLVWLRRSRGRHIHVVVLGSALALALIPYESSLRLLLEVLFGYRQQEIIYPENAFLDFNLLLPLAAYAMIYLAILYILVVLQRSKGPKITN